MSASGGGADVLRQRARLTLGEAATIAGNHPRAERELALAVGPKPSRSLVARRAAPDGAPGFLAPGDRRRAAARTARRRGDRPRRRSKTLTFSSTRCGATSRGNGSATARVLRRLLDGYNHARFESLAGTPPGDAAASPVGVHGSGRGRSRSGPSFFSPAIPSSNARFFVLDPDDGAVLALSLLPRLRAHPIRIAPRPRCEQSGARRSSRSCISLASFQRAGGRHAPGVDRPRR